MDNRKAFDEIDMTAAMKSLDDVKESIRNNPKLQVEPKIRKKMQGPSLSMKPDM